MQILEIALSGGLYIQSIDDEEAGYKRHRVNKKEMQLPSFPVQWGNSKLTITCKEHDKSWTEINKLPQVGQATLQFITTVDLSLDIANKIVGWPGTGFFKFNSTIQSMDF